VVLAALLSLGLYVVHAIIQNKCLTNKLLILRIQKKVLHVSAAVRSLLQGMSILKDACSVAIVNFTVCNASMLLKHQRLMLF
jgi:hypothetical protein